MRFENCVPPQSLLLGDKGAWLDAVCAPQGLLGLRSIDDRSKSSAALQSRPMPLRDVRVTRRGA